MVTGSDSEISFSTNNNSTYMKTITGREYHNSLMGAVLAIKTLGSEDGARNPKAINEQQYSILGVTNMNKSIYYALG